MLPFELPTVSRGYATLTSSIRRLGSAAASAAAGALAELLDTEVALEARAIPGPTWSRTPVARLAIDLPAVPAVATLEVEPALVVQLVDRLGGGDGTGVAPAASALTPLEQATFELLTLLAVDGACCVREIEQALGPRLMRACPPPDPGALGVELELRAGAAQGRARLLLPAPALRALAGAPALDESRIRLAASIRDGEVALLPAELEALEPGDVVVLDARAAPRAALVLPGGWRATGRLEPDGLHVEETSVPTRTSQIPITLEVELCRLELSLAELARLEPGGILPLALDRRGLVTLRAGDRSVAQGELVEVDGALGVRISSLEVDP